MRTKIKGDENYNRQKYKTKSRPVCLQKESWKRAIENFFAICISATFWMIVPSGEQLQSTIFFTAAKQFCNKRHFGPHSLKKVQILQCKKSALLPTMAFFFKVLNFFIDCNHFCCMLFVGAKIVCHLKPSNLPNFARDFFAF